MSSTTDSRAGHPPASEAVGDAPPRAGVDDGRAATSTPRGSRVSRLLVLALLAPVWLSVGSGPAAAHSALVSSDPHDGARLERLPGRVSLAFTEEVSTPAYVVVRTPGGRSLAAGDPDVEGATVSQALDVARGGVSGEVTVAYRVVSLDGHPVTGEVAFTVAPRSGPAAEPSADPGAEPSADPDAATGADEGTAGDGTATATSTPARPDGFWATHGSHYLLGGFLVLVAGGLLWLARGRATS